jgi:hypothetical protein
MAQSLRAPSKSSARQHCTHGDGNYIHNEILLGLSSSGCETIEDGSRVDEDTMRVEVQHPVPEPSRANLAGTQT